MAEKKEVKKTEKKEEKVSSKVKKPVEKKVDKPKEKFAKPKEKKKEEKVIEKKFRISLKKVYSAPRPKRANRAITAIKRFMAKNVRIKAEDVLISNSVNQFVWSRGREHVPKAVDVKVLIVEGKANVYLQTEKVEKKKKKEDKKEEKKAEKEEEKDKEAEKKKEDKKLAEKSAEKADFKKGMQK